MSRHPGQQVCVDVVQSICGWFEECGAPLTAAQRVLVEEFEAGVDRRDPTAAPVRS